MNDRFIVAVEACCCGVESERCVGGTPRCGMKSFLGVPSTA